MPVSKFAPAKRGEAPAATPVIKEDGEGVAESLDIRLGMSFSEWEHIKNKQDEQARAQAEAA